MQITELRKELKFNAELVQLIETLKNIAASQSVSYTHLTLPTIYSV